MFDCYATWALCRFCRRFVAYIILLPVLLALAPVMFLGDTFSRAYYRLKDW